MYTQKSIYNYTFSEEITSFQPSTASEDAVLYTQRKWINTTLPKICKKDIAHKILILLINLIVHLIIVDNINPAANHTVNIQYAKMTIDIFDNTILCNKCESKMKKAKIVKNGFLFRAVICPQCNSKIIHPADEQEYNKFINLKNKDFRVKMRIVGNSYTVSIPKEIVSFMRDQEKIMDNMVKLCFEEMGRLSLNFGGLEQKRKIKNVQ
ncbi:MAG: hypothetical protein ABIB79_02550 [archaeon]